MAIRMLDDPHRSDLASVGGKALNLGLLTRAGFPVPRGFCVTTDAYRQVVGDRLSSVLAALADCAPGETARLAQLAGQARRIIADTPVPAAIADEIAAGYQRLGADVPVAVRSSATAEDLADASFAGQQDTYLNVVGTPAVLAAVRDCWASLWTDRAVSYRTSNGIDPAGVALAVVVQQLVDAAAAGVMFTANPVTGCRDQLVIDASPGLGEAVVSGAVNPDHFVLDPAGIVLERRLGAKELLIRSVPGGGTERVARAAGNDDACLSDAQLRSLAQLGVAVQEHYRAPQDTEWALDAGGRLWLTQARPITTLYPRLGRPDKSGLRAFLCMSLAQGITRPITPMGLASFRLIGSSVRATALGAPAADPLAGPAALQIAGQRLFLDVTEALQHRPTRRFVLAVFSVMEARAAQVLTDLSGRVEFELRRTPARSLLRGLFRIAHRTKAPLRLVAGLLDPGRAYAAIERSERRLRTQLRPAASATPAERLDLVERRLGSDIFLLMPITISYCIGGFAMLPLARRLLGDRLEPGDLATVLRGLPHNPTTEMDIALWDVAEAIRADTDARVRFERSAAADLAAAYHAGTLPVAAERSLGRFLQRYGHRAVTELDLGMPRWSDDPSYLCGVLRNYLALDDPALAPSAQFAAAVTEGEAMVATLAARAAERGRLRGRLVRWALGRTRALAGLRESPKFLLILAFAQLRAQLLEVGRALAVSDVVAQPDDVFFLDLAEARRGLAGEPMQGLVQQRRADYAAELRRRRIPRILLSDGTEPEATFRPATAPDGALIGAPASAGLVTAPARVILDPVGAYLEPGEILVAPSTDPGWTPLFLTAGGLVMEMGGSNSHGAVVAREYGIPAVVGVPDATHAISTGQLVTVDGAAGLVKPA